jgi:FtsP/CotA-like multicopper oxidase with cupredoxin domain
MLTGGETSLALEAQVGEVVRFYFTNTANTRLFNVALPGARMKLVGSDSGRYEHETFVDEVLLAPSERAVVDVRFDTAGTTPIEHRTPDRTYPLGTVEVTDTATTPSSAPAFEQLRSSNEFTSWRARLDDHVARRPDKTLAFKSRMPLLYGDQDSTATAYTCPMHPDVVSTEPGTCPQCGMKLVPAPSSFVCPMHPDVTSDAGGTCPKCGMRLVPATNANGDVQGHTDDHEHAHAHGMPDGLEWEDLMPEINAASNAHNMIWQLVDVDTGKQNWEIDWAFRVGDLVKIRLLNDMDRTTRCTTRSTSTAPAGSSSSPETTSSSRTWPGRTPCSYAPVRSSTSCSRSPTQGCGWRTATSPNTTRPG